MKSALFLLAAFLPLALCSRDLSSLDPLTATRDLSSLYPLTATLFSDNSDIYELYWTFSVEEKSITFAVNVSTTGWVGFGLSPNGGMLNSDVVIAWVDDDGNQYLHVSKPFT